MASVKDLTGPEILTSEGGGLWDLRLAKTHFVSELEPCSQALHNILKRCCALAVLRRLLVLILGSLDIALG